MYRRTPSGAYRGMGMYPDETCFDPNRWSKLPYWIDNPTESACKLNLLISGNTSGNTAQPGTFDTGPDGTPVPIADPATVLNAQSACKNSGGSWDPALQACAPGVLSQVSPYFLWGGLGLFAISILFGGRR